MAHDLQFVVMGDAEPSQIDTHAVLPDKRGKTYSAKALREWAALHSQHKAYPAALSNATDPSVVISTMERIGAEYVGGDQINNLFFEVDGHRLAINTEGIEYVGRTDEIREGYSYPDRNGKFTHGSEKPFERAWTNPVEHRASETARLAKYDAELDERKRRINEEYRRDFTFYASTTTGDLDFVIDHRGTHEVTITPAQYYAYEDNPDSLPPYKHEDVSADDWVNPEPPDSYQPQMTVAEVVEKPTPDKLSISKVAFQTGWNSDQIRDFAREAGIPMTKRQRTIGVADFDRMLDSIYGDHIADRQATPISVGLLDVEDATHVVSNVGLPAGDPYKAVAEAAAAKQAEIAARGQPTDRNLPDADKDGIADAVDPVIGERFVGREWETLSEEKLNNRVYLMEEATVDARLPFAVRVERENGEILATRRFEDEEAARRHMDSEIELGNRVAEANAAYEHTPRGADEPNLLGATAEGIPKADNEHEMLNQSLDDSRTNYTMLGSWHLPGRERTLEHEKFIAGFNEVKGDLERLEDAGEIYYIYSNGYVLPAIEGKALSAMPYDEYLKRRVTGEWPIPNEDGEYENRLDGWKAIEWKLEMERLKASELPRMTRAERIADFKEKQDYLDVLVESGELAQVYSNGYVLTNDQDVMRYDRYLAEQEESPDGGGGRGQMRPDAPQPSDPAEGEVLSMSRKSDRKVVDEIVDFKHGRRYSVEQDHDGKFTVVVETLVEGQGTGDNRVISSSPSYAVRSAATRYINRERKREERDGKPLEDGMPEIASPVAPLTDFDGDGIADVVDPDVSEEIELGEMFNDVAGGPPPPTPIRPDVGMPEIASPVAPLTDFDGDGVADVVDPDVSEEIELGEMFNDVAGGPPPPTPIRPDVEILPPSPAQPEQEPQVVEQPAAKDDGWETVTEEVDERRNVKYIHKASADGLSHIVITETLGDLPDEQDSFTNVGYSAETIDVSNLYTKAGATRYLKNQKGLGDPEEEDGEGRLLMNSATNPDYDTQGGTYKRDVKQIVDEDNGYRHTVKQPYGFGAGYVVVTETLDGEHVTASKEYKSLGAVTRYINKNTPKADSKAASDDEPKGVDDLFDIIAPVAEASIEVAMERGGGISTVSDVSLGPVGGALGDHGDDIVMAVIEEEIPGGSLVVDVALDAVDSYEPKPAKAKKAKRKKGRSKADIISAAASKASKPKKKAAPKGHPFLSKAEARR